ncbi:glucose-1-phosphate thymidylyltransferase RfbA [Legionella lytica]|uniref:Glucose-1-phosphate thymidylyltransferase n=1 Tax=Legionella lytica TaxID=96232 RepID=A0ABW8D8W2_9GAMM
MKRKGIILAGGAGTRLNPSTTVISKQLLPVFDKPMVYYPLSTLMLAGIRDILVISTPRDLALYQQLLGTGEQWGINLEYVIQPTPAGLPQAFILGESFINDDPCVLILGDNIFYGHELSHLYASAMQQAVGATVFAYHVHDPERYGVAEFDAMGKVISLEEKPNKPKSNYAVTGLYFYDQNVVRLAHDLKPSARGELEISDLNRWYLEHGKLNVKLIGKGQVWFDTGTFQSLLAASMFVSEIQSRQGLKIACLEEIAYRKKWIDAKQLERLAQPLLKNEYGHYLISLLKEEALVLA